MQRSYPFFIQYHVRQSASSAGPKPGREGFATVIVFAESAEQARARAGRAVADNRLEIVRLLRIHVVSPQALNGLGSVLRALYEKAERLGFGLHFDPCPITGHC
jgi:hypothetical protein